MEILKTMKFNFKICFIFVTAIFVVVFVVSVIDVLSSFLLCNYYVIVFVIFIIVAIWSGLIIYSGFAWLVKMFGTDGNQRYSKKSLQSLNLLVLTWGWGWSARKSFESLPSKSEI